MAEHYQAHLRFICLGFWMNVITANSETFHPHQIFAVPTVSQSPRQPRPTHENAALCHSGWAPESPALTVAPHTANLPSDPAALAAFHAVSIQTISSGTHKVSPLPEQVLALNQTRQLFAKLSSDV